MGGTPVCMLASQPSLFSHAFYQAAELGPISHSASVLSDVARPALPQPRATAELIIDHSAGILSTLSLAGGALINNLVRVMDSVRIIA